MSPSKKKILIVEDDKHISRLIKYNLEKAGYDCLLSVTGEDGLKVLESGPVSLVILDIMLPKMDGLEVCRTIRNDSRRKNIPIIMLTAKGEEVDRVLGLELGADDYIVKPFSPRELLARIKAVLRRGQEKESEEEIFQAGSLKIDFSKVLVSVDNKAAALTSKEFELLKTLVKAKGRVLSRDYLLNAIWGYEHSLEIQTRTVDVHIQTLRRKLKKEAKRILTVKNYGYRFVLKQENNCIY